jgi:hypothetical protein
MLVTSTIAITAQGALLTAPARKLTKLFTVAVPLVAERRTERSPEDQF